EQINQSLIRFSSLRRKARERATQVRTVERSVLVHPPREKASAERADWNENDSNVFQWCQHLLFRLSPPQRVFVLDCCDWLNCMCATNRLHSRLRKSEVLHLAFL